MATLLRDLHFVVQHHLTSAYVQVIRTEEPFLSLSMAERAFSACQKAIESVDVSAARGILVDFRRAPMSTDPELHKVLVLRGDILIKPFARSAFLLSTRVGRMQTERINRSYSQSGASIFDDENTAVRFLLDDI